MKIAILSDLHSNLEALTACTRHATENGVGRFVCLGDCVGYGPNPVETLDLLRSLPGLVTVLGNHDEHLIVEDIERPVNPATRQAIEWTRKQLRAEQREFLGSLPLRHVEAGVTYVHATADEPQEWEYLLEPEQVKRCFEAADTGLVFIGHVHVPDLFHLADDGQVETVTVTAGKPVMLQPHHRYVVNVGSVGQPRDGNPDASFVIYDEVRNSVCFERVPYDYGATGAKILRAGLNPFFAERLAQGR